MTIYSRFGSPVTLTRPITTTADVQRLENRSTDTHDLERLGYGMYVAGTIEGSAAERLFDLALLRADGGIEEINEAARDVGGNPK